VSQKKNQETTKPASFQGQIEMASLGSIKHVKPFPPRDQSLLTSVFVTFCASDGHIASITKNSCELSSRSQSPSSTEAINASYVPYEEIRPPELPDLNHRGKEKRGTGSGIEKNSASRAKDHQHD